MAKRSFSGAEGGGVSIVAALSGVALLGFAGMATDVGAVYLQSRRLQGAADLAAMAAAQNPRQAEALATQTVRANDWPQDTRIGVTIGRYTPDRARAPAARFTQGGSANAVRVELEAHAPLFFARLFAPDGRMTIRRHALAAQTRLASFQIGSRLLSLQGGVANQLLSALTGSSVSLSVMDYNALAHADVDLLSYVDALRARLDVTAATYDEALRQRMSGPEALDALADVLAAQGGAGESPMRRLARSASGLPSLREGLAGVLDLGPYGAQNLATRTEGAQIRVSALDLATAILEIAGGDRQVRLQLGAGVPGLAATDVWLAIGERPNHSPWLTVSNDDSVTIRTAQMRLFIDAHTAPLAGLAQVRLPALVELASAQARLSDISCSFDLGRREVTLAVAPSVGALLLGEIDVSQLDNFKRDLNPQRVDVARIGPAAVSARGRITIGGEEWQDVRFGNDDITVGAVKTVSTHDIARATLSSLVAQTDLSVRAGGLARGLPTQIAPVRAALSAAARPLDDLLNSLTELLGVRLGEADVRVNGVRCGGAALVG
ncbi:MAG: TadG family pilus assembly protein [Hyphomonadaceae bacterium]